MVRYQKHQLVILILVKLYLTQILIHSDSLQLLAAMNRLEHVPLLVKEICSLLVVWLKARVIMKQKALFSLTSLEEHLLNKLMIILVLDHSLVSVIELKEQLIVITNLLFLKLVIQMIMGTLPLQAHQLTMVSSMKLR